jgi:protoporphyrin/coproporphyrin ferrochelatase
MTDKMRIGVVLMNLGGPTHENNVRTFLRNLFKDEDIIKLGGGAAQNLFANVISKFRAPSVAEDYKEINGCPNGCTGNKHCFNRQNKEVSTCCSPINGLTESQRRGLEKYFKKILPEHEVKVYTCMRYWLPFADQIMDDMVEDGITHTVLMPLYPQFSWTTTGSSFRDWENTLQEKFPNGEKPWKEFHVKNYYKNEAYLGAINDRIDEALGEMDEETRRKTHLIFSAHGTPLLEVRSGDPYTVEIKETMEAVMERREVKNSYWLGFQSKVGPQKWTQPNTEELVKRHLEYGIKNFLMVPIAFVTDHIETLYELGVELVEDLEEEGFEFESLKVMKGLNDHPGFIQALAEETLNSLKHEISPDAVQWDNAEITRKKEVTT